MADAIRGGSFRNGMTGDYMIEKRTITGTYPSAGAGTMDIDIKSIAPDYYKRFTVTENFIFANLRPAIAGNTDRFSYNINPQYNNTTGILTVTNFHVYLTSGAYHYGNVMFDLFVYWNPLVNPLIRYKLTRNMTSNNTPAPFVVSASSIWDSTYPAWRVFDGAITGSDRDWWSASGSFPGGVGNEWIQIDLGSQEEINIFRVYNNRTNSVIGIIDFTLQGSNNGTSFTIIHTVTGRTSSSNREFTEYKLSSTANYRYYRLNITRISIPGATALGQLELIFEGYVR